MQGQWGKERVWLEKQWPLPSGGTWGSLQGTKNRAGGLSSLSSPQDEAEIPLGSGPASVSQGGPDHSGRVQRPQQLPGRRPGPRPSEPPHKEMFVPRRRGLWAVARLVPSSPLPPPRPGHLPDGPDWGGRTQEEPPRAGAQGPPPQPPPCLAPGGMAGKAKLGWTGKCVGGWGVQGLVLGGPPALLPEGDTLPGGAEAGQKPLRLLPPANCLCPRAALQG